MEKPVGLEHLNQKPMPEPIDAHGKGSGAQRLQRAQHNARAGQNQVGPARGQTANAAPCLVPAAGAVGAEREIGRAHV